jgi:23S rRNA pseudouridine1911/1915/1917 synthase
MNNSSKIKDKFIIKVDKDNQQIRIDKFLSLHLNDFSRSKIQQLIDSKFVKLSNTTIITINNYKVQEGDEFHISIPEKTATSLQAKNIKFDVIFEDEYLAIIDKPAGLTVHPGSGTGDDTLVHGLIAKFGNNLSDIGGNERPGIIHRLDKNTSGLMIIAKLNSSHIKLSKMIESRDIKRTYLAVALGIPKPTTGTIKKNITRSNRDRKKMGVVEFGGRMAITHYDLIEVYKHGLASLIECRLETGRTHQIRVHLSNIGNPILGDPEYGNFKAYKINSLGQKVQEQLKNMQRQALHSAKLSFIHPINNQNLYFESPLPNDISKLVELLKLND